MSRRLIGRELYRSKACVIPLGYGELCWHDIEAIAAKAVIVKQDMSNLSIKAALYRDGDTYFACRGIFQTWQKDVTKY